MSNDYECIKFLEIRFADPISSLKLVNNYVVTGTMMGRVNLYNINDGKTYRLSELNSENISDISYNEKEELFYVGIGDEEIRGYDINTLSENSNNEKRSIQVHESDLQHTNKCENAFVLLSPESFFRVQLAQIDEGTLNIVIMESEYDFKYFDETRNPPINENFKNYLPTTNYIVPFDFDGKRFLWVEFLSSTQRNICVSQIPLPITEKPYKFDLNKSIGHICQAKLLPNNRVFIVHTLNKCEIRALDYNFTLLYKFEHIGEEVLGVDIYYNMESEKVQNPNEENVILHTNLKHEINFDRIKKSEDINTNRILDTSDNARKKEKENGDDNYLYIRQKQNKEKEIDLNHILIITLDIDGNVNLFQDLKEETLFNLYNLRGISQDHKDKHFFSMGYAYYIKSNLRYFCISSDHGCYIIKKKDEDNNNNY
jgi:WD40 repeat protein